MSNSVNIAAIATGAFLGFLGLSALLFCIPPVTRFLGDLCCCPWRIPFTREKRLNDDEELDKDDLPYVTGSPRPGTPVDDRGYQQMSAAYMSAVSVVDPGAAKEEMGQSGEYQRWSQYSNESYQEEMYPSHGQHLQVPHTHLPQQGDWRRHSPVRNYEYQQPQAPYGAAIGYPRRASPERWSTERWSNYPPQAPYDYAGRTPSPEPRQFSSHYDGYAAQHEVQRPEPSYSHPAASTHHLGDGYFPTGKDEHIDYARQYYPVQVQAQGVQRSYPNI